MMSFVSVKVCLTELRISGVGYQNKGYGKQLLNEIEKRVVEYGAKHIELTSVNDEHHMHFYKGFGMYAATNLKIMGKHYEW